MSEDRSAVRAIAFYLPQYHPVPENNAWWGAGFTEWRGVSQAIPMFQGHEQPHEPADFGFYDLRVADTRQAQADMARAYGIHGFCYYHYWFDGKRLLDRPLEEVIQSKQPDFPFCVAWANEPWARNWVGRPDEILAPQTYVRGWEEAFFLDLLSVLKDERYIRVNGRPLLLISRALQIPEIRRVAARWRELTQEHGLPGIYLAAVQSLDMVNPDDCGFDAAVEMPPFGAALRRYRNDSLPQVNAAFRGTVVPYAEVVEAFTRKPHPDYTWFRGAMPGWDNSPRRGPSATVYWNNTPETYRRWLDALVQWTVSHREGDERLIFINAWNEWGEGAHLEPDLRHGHAYLRETCAALSVEPADAPSLNSAR